MPPWRRPVPPPAVPLDPVTVRELARVLAKRIDDVTTYGAGGCAACHDAEARAFLAQLRKLADG